MRKIVTISLLLLAFTMNAQITFWGTGVGRVYDPATQSTVFDTISCVVNQYEYSEVDLISSRQEEMYGKEYNRTYLCLWKEGQIIDPAAYSYGVPMYINDAVFKANDMYGRVGIDSIVWHPYALKNVYMPIEQDTMPVVELYGSNARTYTISIEPHYATISYGISYSDTSIVNASIEKVINNRSSLNFNNGLALTITPKKEGSTMLTFTFNNSFRKQMAIVVGPTPEIPDETSLPIDSLYEKIYSRLVLSGDMQPVGKPDFSGGDEGSMSFFRTMFNLQELGADQLYWVWADYGINEVVKNTVTAQNNLVEMFFHRLYYNIWLCNSYLKRTENQERLAIKRAEVRFLRAYFYYYLLDMFGNVPIVTNNSEFKTTPQSTRKQLYDFIESELLAIEPNLSAVGYKEDYYRVDKAAAWLLLSRLYLNAPVYYSANTEYDKAAQYAYKVIQSPYDLASHYRWLFMGDNDKKSTINDAWKEIIFAIRQNGKETASYGGSIFLIASMSKYDMPFTGCENTWYCIRSRGEAVDLFFADPLNAAQGTANELTQDAQDDRARFCNNYNNSIWNYRGRFECCETGFYGGWAVQKWSNWYVDSGDSIRSYSDKTWPDTDVPLMRKAEAYLNYAEAVIRGGAQLGNLSAVEAVNIIRRRANAAELREITLNDILDERGREFFAEGYRRSDLIRFNKYGGNTGYQWEGKSNVKEGRDFPQYMNLYPIPATFLPSIYNGRQNDGY